jgi:cytochrome c5
LGFVRKIVKPHQPNSTVVNGRNPIQTQPPGSDSQDLVMSNTQHTETQSEEHSSAIKTPKQLIVTIALAFVVPILIIFLLVNYVTSGSQVGAGSDALSPEATAKRIAPVARLDLVDASGPKVFKTGEQVYKAVCAGCHAAGVAGAPKFGDAVAWTPAIKTGLDTMVSNAIKGKNAMPAKGGNPTLDDYEISRTVVYMANNAGGKFEEPAEPAPAEPAK